jgi:hypothetical protein
MTVGYLEQAMFYRAALLLGLIRGERVVAWADSVLVSDASAPAAFADIAICPPDDLTLMRQRLLQLTPAKESEPVVQALIGLAHRDLSSGRRSLGDTMTVLKQLRAFVAVSRELNEQLKTLGVDMAMSPPDSPARAAAETRVRGWLAQHQPDAVPFIG